MDYKWQTLLEKMTSAEASRLQACFTAIDDEIRSSLKQRGSSDGISAASLARLLLLVSIGKSDNERISRKSKRKVNVVKWTALAEDITNFVKNLPEEIRINCCYKPRYTDDNIGGFGSFASREGGTSEKFFYSTILLYVISSASSPEFHSEFLDAMVSREDRVFIVNASIAIQDRLKVRPDSRKRLDVVAVSQRFFIERDLQAELMDFAEKFTVPNPSRNFTYGFQLAVYRPMRSNPDSLIKSFVAVYDQSGDILEENGFTYTHFYKPQDSFKKMRFGRGKVIPVRDAIYLVGGQRPHTPLGSPMPYNSLKIIAIRWADVRQCHSIFPVLIMTTNYEGRLLVSRAAARLTPIDHSDHANLGAVSVSDLQEVLREESDIEKRRIMEMEGIDSSSKDQLLGSFPLTVEFPDFSEIAKQIAYFSNNDPNTESGWCVPDGFRNSKKSLTTNDLRSLVGDAVGESGRDPFVDELGNKYSLWDHTRFGPLRIDQ